MAHFSLRQMDAILHCKGLVDRLPHVHPDQGLDVALERMGANQLEILRL